MYEIDQNPASTNYKQGGGIKDPSSEVAYKRLFPLIFYEQKLDQATNQAFPLGKDLHKLQKPK